jgi:adenylyltransferase/sulfurtransferase
MNAPDLSPDEILRYSRHLIMPEVGLEGQRKLKAASVLLVGAGGLGSPSALYLAAAGIGRIGLVDCDVVDFTNLQRQVIHGTPDVGRTKLESARSKVEAINPNVDVVTYETLLSSENALQIFANYDVVVDGTDNFPTRYLVNDACVMLGKPNCYGSIFRFDGQATVFHHPVAVTSDQSEIQNPKSKIELGPCYRCLYPEPPPPGTVPSCAEGGVLGILPGVIGLIQSTEAVKIILGKGETLSGRLLLYDALNMRFRELKIRRDPRCPVCGDSPTLTKLIDYYSFCGVPGHGVNQALYEDEIEPTEVRAMQVRGEPFVLVDVREPHELEINRIAGSRLIPLRDLPARVHELDTADEIVVHCLMGGRSAEACQFLKAAGFKKVRNLRGGIRKWIDDVEPGMVKY